MSSALNSSVLTVAATHLWVVHAFHNFSAEFMSCWLGFVCMKGCSKVLPTSWVHSSNIWSWWVSFLFSCSLFWSFLVSADIFRGGNWVDHRICNADFWSLTSGQSYLEKKANWSFVPFPDKSLCYSLPIHYHYYRCANSYYLELTVVLKFFIQLSMILILDRRCVSNLCAVFYDSDFVMFLDVS
jgi:hypothetical protein